MYKRQIAPMKGSLDFLKGTWLGHPLHPIFAHVPMAMWPGALICDLLSRCSIGGDGLGPPSFFAIFFRLAVARFEPPTGLVDGSAIKREKPAWKIGLYHLSLNLVATLLFAVNFGLRLQTFHDATMVAVTPLLLSIVGQSF